MTIARYISKLANLLNSDGKITSNSVAEGTLVNFKNRVINGGMDVAQRGTSFAAAADTTYSIDMFKYFKATTGAVTISQDSSVPPDTEFTKSLKVLVTTADSAVATADYSLICTHIEGYNIRDLFGKPITISFWVKSSKLGKHCLRLDNAVDRSYVVEYSIGMIDTWEKKVITVPNGLLNTGTWSLNQNLGLRLAWTLMSGTVLQTTPDVWNSSGLCTVNQVNVLDTVNNSFSITGVQLEKGAIASEFEFRPYQVELALCQRYLQKLTSYIEVTTSAGYTYNNWFFKVPFRVAPLVTNTGNGAGGNIYNITPLYVGLYTTSGGGAIWGATSTATAEF